jgi:hypothetical protein
MVSLCAIPGGLNVNSPIERARFMAVRVTLNKSTNTLEFRPETAEDGSVADYLSGLVNQAKGNLSKSGPASLQKAKADLLIKQAEASEAKARDVSTSVEIRDYHEAKAREARKLAKELAPSS